MRFTIKIKNQEKELFSQSAENELFVSYEGEYNPGDAIHISCSEKNVFVKIRLDDSMEEVFAFLKDEYILEIPFDEKKASHNPKAFTGKRHYIYIREAFKDEISQRKNLALNPYDYHQNKTLFPRTWANVETRGEAVFASRNAIDGYLANTFHGEWPFSSWGINRNPDAEFHLEFGRKIKTDCIAIYLRADFPHDAWWTEGTIEFSDGTNLNLSFKKTGEAQYFNFPEKEIESLKLYKLIKAEDPSPFPALTQIKVFGTEA